MEKEKPFSCEVCGKRYKNLNGLKYVSGWTCSVLAAHGLTPAQHKQHSMNCDPDTIAQRQELINMVAAVTYGQNGIPLAFSGLPDIGEENNLQ